jgi:hypothetical protein
MVTTVPPTTSRVEGLTAIQVSGGTWQNWDADLEDDGPEIYIVYLDRNGNIISDDSTETLPISADVKVYASKNSIATKDQLVFSKHYSESEIILGDIYPRLRIPKEQISPDAQTLYQYGRVEIEIHTPEQGDFAAQSDFIELYK